MRSSVHSLNHLVTRDVPQDRGVRAIVRMHCYGPTCVLRDPAVLSWPEVQTMHRVTGDDCSVLLVAVQDIPAFETLLDRLSIYGQSTSSMVLDDLIPWSPVLPPGVSGPDSAG